METDFCCKSTVPSVPDLPDLSTLPRSIRSIRYLVKLLGLSEEEWMEWMCKIDQSVVGADEHVKTSKAGCAGRAMDRW